MNWYIAFFVAWTSLPERRPRKIDASNGWLSFQTVSGINYFIIIISNLEYNKVFLVPIENQVTIFNNKINDILLSSYYLTNTKLVKF